MKPSERRALKELQEKEKAFGEQATVEINTVEKIPPKPPKSQKPKEPKEPKYNADRGSIRRFFDSHVRLITFIISAVVVLGVLSPFGIDMLVSSMQDEKVTDKKDISMGAVQSIYDNAESMTWRSFENFNYTDYSREDGKYFIREYPISDSKLVLKVGGSKLSGTPDYIYLISYETGEHVDLMKEDAKEFISKFETD
jgi:hypothetical protein